MDGASIGGLLRTYADGRRGEAVQLPYLLPDRDKGDEMVGGTAARLVGLGLLSPGFLLLLGR